MTIDFTDAQLDYLFNVLAQRPYHEVVQLIDSIRNQVGEENARRNPNGSGPGSAPADADRSSAG